MSLYFVNYILNKRFHRQSLQFKIATLQTFLEIPTAHNGAQQSSEYRNELDNLLILCADFTESRSYMDLYAYIHKTPPFHLSGNDIRVRVRCLLSDYQALESFVYHFTNGLLGTMVVIIAVLVNRYL